MWAGAKGGLEETGKVEATEAHFLRELDKGEGLIQVLLNEHCRLKQLRTKHGEAFLGGNADRVGGSTVHGHFPRENTH